MSIDPPKVRRRVKRGTSVEGPQGFWGQLLERTSRTDVLVRLAICLVASAVLMILLHGWTEPLPFQIGSVPPRGVVARVPFEKPDPERTRTFQERAAAQVRVVYAQDKSPIVRLRDGLKNRVLEIAASDTLAAVSREAWLEFAPEATDALQIIPVPPPADTDNPAARAPIAPEPPDVTPMNLNPTPVEDEAGILDVPPDPKRDSLKETPLSPQELANRQLIGDAENAFQLFRGRVDSKEKQLSFEKAVERAFSETEKYGVLEKIQHDIDEGSQTEIDIHPLGAPVETTRVPVAKVLLGEVKVDLKSSLEDELGAGAFVDRLVSWIEPRLSGSLEIDREATIQSKEDAIAKTPQQFSRYAEGEVLAEAGLPVDADTMSLLESEHEEFIAQQSGRSRAGRAISLFGLFVAMFSLAGFYIHLHHNNLLDDLGGISTLVALSVLTVVICILASGEGWRAEIVPLLVFAMTIAIAYDEDLALLLAAEVALVAVVGLGRGLSEYLTLTAASAAAVFWMGSIRSRSKLIYVGLWAGVVAFSTQLGASLIVERPFSTQLLYEAARSGAWAVLAGFLMTGLLPFIERTFGVLTDLSLLEVGDVAHPLLQELVRRAPGTYNHSINVASLGEAAADAIGARGLLVRVAAYFHDIGKMLKPAYFVENQGNENRHESLMPAKSTLIIIAHVKEGVELARQYNLPQPIIDLIAQHHGTTLVEYFYRRATERKQASPDDPEVDEQTYRYPGPKPKTRESAVMMLADAAESASRALTEPTPSRIAGLVHDLAIKRLLDGQFDDCGLTLGELEIIEQSLVKSLTAVYHGRVKYPDQRTA